MELKEKFDKGLSVAKERFQNILKKIEETTGLAQNNAIRILKIGVIGGIGGIIIGQFSDEIKGLFNPGKSGEGTEQVEGEESQITNVPETKADTTSDDGGKSEVGDSTTVVKKEVIAEVGEEGTEAEPKETPAQLTQAELAKMAADIDAAMNSSNVVVGQTKNTTEAQKKAEETGVVANGGSIE